MDEDSTNEEMQEPLDTGEGIETYSPTEIPEGIPS